MSWPLPVNQVKHTQFRLSSGEPHSAMPLKEGPLWAAGAVRCPDKHPISKMLFCFADRLVVSGRKYVGLPSTRSVLMWLESQGKETHTHTLTHTLPRTQLETCGKQKMWKSHIPSSHPRVSLPISQQRGDTCGFNGICHEDPQQCSRGTDHKLGDPPLVPSYPFLAEAFPGSSACLVSSLHSFWGTV